MTEDLHERVMRKVSSLLAEPDRNNAQKLAAATHLLGKYRAELVKQHVLARCGLVVQSGPFAGMKYVSHAAEGCFVPKLLGTYEAELHELIESLAERGYDCLINVGCAEGYYAVGLARRLPAAEVFAYDNNPAAQRLCRALAQQNGVASRVHVRGTFQVGELEEFGGRRTLVLCDIEGRELDLLDPHEGPQLREVDLLVEMHDSPGSAVSQILPPRFADSHDVRTIGHGARDPNCFSALQGLAHLDQWIAVWEWRGGPTPWAWMQTRR